MQFAIFCLSIHGFCITSQAICYFFAFKFLKIRLVAQVAQETSRRGSRQPDVRDFLTVWGLALESFTASTFIAWPL